MAKKAKKTCVVGVCVTPAQKREIADAALRAQRPVAAWLRMVALAAAAQKPCAADNEDAA